MSYIRVLDEGNAIQDHCVEMNFVGAGVTATRPFTNDRVTVTIPGAADVSGWTDDGAVVRLTTVGDRVAIGAAVSVATEKVRIVNAAGVALRVEGREDFPKTGTAAGAATQAPSYVQRFTASMWNAAGAAEVERDYDVYAAPSTLADDETTSRALYAIDYEGFRLLSFEPSVPAPVAVPGCIIKSTVPDGTIPFILRAVNDIGGANVAFCVQDNEAGALTNLFFVLGGGSVQLGAGGAYLDGGGLQVVTARQPAIADVANGVDVGPDNVLRADVRAIKAMLRTHGLMAP